MRYMSRFFLILAGFCLIQTATAADPFQPLLDDIDHNVTPQTTSLGDVILYLDDGRVNRKIHGGREVQGGTVVECLTFHSVPVYLDGAFHDDTEIFTMIAYPEKADPESCPGLLMLHGGGGTVQKSGFYYKLRAWAEAGYVAIGCDLPGIAGENVKDSKGTWTTVPYSQLTAHRFTTTPSIKACWLYTAEATALKAFALLKAHPLTDPNRLGVTGISWGGYSSTFVSGLLGERVKASFSVWGSGYYDEDSNFQKYILPTSGQSMFKNDPASANEWLNIMDAGRRASGIRSHFFLAAASNDNWFRPPAVNPTYLSMVNTASRNLQYAPNDNHKAKTPGGTTYVKGSPHQRRSFFLMENAFFDYHLKGEGCPMPTVSLGSSVTALSDTRSVPVTIQHHPSITIKDITVQYSLPDQPWTRRKWLPGGTVGNQTASPSGDLTTTTCEITLPEEVTAQSADWYVLVITERDDGFPLTVSTPVYSGQNGLLGPVDSIAMHRQ